MLRIGGLKEKLLAARRGGISTLIIPQENERDLQEVPDDIIENLHIRPVKWIDEVLAIALEKTPEPLSDEAYLEGSATMTGADDTEGGSQSENRPRSH